MSLFNNYFPEKETAGFPEINGQLYKSESQIVEIDGENDGSGSRFPKIDAGEYGSESQVTESNCHFGNWRVNFDFVYYDPNRDYNGNIRETGTFCSFDEAEAYNCDQKLSADGFECPSCLVDDEAEEAMSEDDVSSDVDESNDGEMVDSEGFVSEDDILDTENDSFSYPPSIDSNRDLVFEVFGDLESDSEYDDMDSLARYFH